MMDHTSTSGNPKFAHMLNSMNRYIGDGRVSVQVERDCKQSKEELTAARIEWLLSTILYEEVKDMSLCHDMGPTVEEDDNSMASLLHNALAHAEAEGYVDCWAQGSGDTLLGVTKTDLNTFDYKKHIKSLQKFAPKLEERLRAKCETMLDFHTPTRSSGSSGDLTTAQAAQLPAFVETDKHRLEAEKTLLIKEQQDRDAEFWQCFEAIGDSLSALESLVSDQRIKAQSHYDKITTEWLVSKCDALALKIRMVELQVMCETYHSETVRALHYIKHQLSEKTDLTKREHRHISQALTTYECVGTGFDELVTEYTNLKKDIENKHWALSELGSVSRS